jgi:hypothetical protein
LVVICIERVGVLEYEYISTGSGAKIHYELTVWHCRSSVNDQRSVSHVSKDTLAAMWESRIKDGSPSSSSGREYPT